MIKVLILVEGTTEEQFVKKVLSTYFIPQDYLLIPILIPTKTVLAGPNFKGGYITYPRIIKEIRKLLNDKSATAVSMILDYYKFPGKSKILESIQKSETTCYGKVMIIEENLIEEINNPKFFPYLQLHEFEAMLFSDIDCMEYEYPGREKDIKKLSHSIDKKFNSPEEIDENEPPKRRIISVFPDYKKAKVRVGPIIANKIGLNKIREKCPHFNEWLLKIESLKQN